jgi:molybdopterin-guanine dinucleotide biosynthesis protein A
MARETGARSLHGAIEPLKPAYIRVPSSEMVNVNTQDDLAEAEHHLAHWNDD